MDCSPSGSSAHGIFPGKIMEWIAIPFSRGSPQSRDQTWVSCIGNQILYPWDTLEAHYWDCCCSVAKSCPTLWDPMDHSTPGFPVRHHLPEFTQVKDGFLFFFYLHIGYACFFACLVIANWKLNILNNRMWQLWTSDILTSLKYTVVTLCWYYCLWLSWTNVCVLCCVWPLKSLLNQLRSQLNIGHMCP